MAMFSARFDEGPIEQMLSWDVPFSSFISFFCSYRMFQVLCQPPITWQVHGISIPQFGLGIRFGACGKLEFMLPECRLSKENPQNVPDSLRPKV